MSAYAEVETAFSELEVKSELGKETGEHEMSRAFTQTRETEDEERGLTRKVKTGGSIASGGKKGKLVRGELSRTTSETTELGTQTRKRGGAIVVGPKGPSGELSLSRARSEKLDGGKTSERSGDTTLTVDRTGIGGEHKRAHTISDADGNKHERAVTLKANSSGEFGAEIGSKKTDADKKNLGSVSLGGGVKLNADGGLDKANLKAEAGKGAYKGSITVEAGFTAGEPALLEDGRWAVDYQESAGGGASFKAGEGETQTISAGVDRKVALGGRRIFATEAEARAFKNHPSQSYLGKRDALELRQGEQLTRESSGSVTLGGGTTFAEGSPISAGAEVGRGAGRAETITRVDDKTVELVKSESLMTSGSGTIGVGGSFGPSIGTREKRTGTRELRYRFDVSTEGGRLLLRDYQATGHVPGACLVSVTTIETPDDNLEANVLVASASRGGSVTHKRTVDAKGVHDDYTGTGRKGAKLLGEELSASGTIDHNSLIAHTEGTDGQALHDELAEAVGAKGPARGDARSSGKWNVTSELDDQQLAHFCGSVSRGGTAVLAPLRQLDGVGADLQRKLRNAKDEAELRKALAEFTAAAGPRGLAWIRAIGGVTDYDVTLEGDKSFVGSGGRLQIEAKLAQHAAAVKAGKGDAPQIARDLVELRQKRLAIGDDRKYSDLPEEMRAHELEKIDGWIDRLTTLVTAAAPETPMDAASSKASSKMVSERGRCYQLLEQATGSRHFFAGTSGAGHDHAEKAFDDAMVELGAAEAAEQKVILQGAGGEVDRAAFADAAAHYRAATIKLISAEAAYRENGPFVGMY